MSLEQDATGLDGDAPVEQVEEPPPFALPRVSPIGIVQQPAGFVARPRVFSRGLRALALVLFLVVVVVTVVTAGLSLGGYCLTTDGNDTRALPFTPAR